MPTSNQIFHNQMGYQLFLPHSYENSKNESFPLFLFLHGVNKRGNDLRLLDRYGLIRVAEHQKNFSYIVVAPQCPEGTFWPEHRNTVMDLLDEVVHHYRVDRGKIYATGFSMGGYGVWDLAAKTEGVFAAAVPIAGWYEVGEACHLTSIPIWTFHGEEDDVVAISGSESMVHAIMEIGGKPKFTRYPGLKHDHIVMYKTYANPELFKWLEGISIA